MICQSIGFPPISIIGLGISAVFSAIRVPNPTTAIGYQLSAFGFTTLKIYDAIGREVATLVNEVKEAGTYTAQFDGAKLSSGIYFAKLTSDRKTQMKKLLLLK